MAVDHYEFYAEEELIGWSEILVVSQCYENELNVRAKGRKFKMVTVYDEPEASITQNETLALILGALVAIEKRLGELIGEKS